MTGGARPNKFLCPFSLFSDSDVTVDSDIEDAIMAQLYFRDVKSKKSGVPCMHE